MKMEKVLPLEQTPDNGAYGVNLYVNNPTPYNFKVSSFQCQGSPTASVGDSVGIGNGCSVSDVGPYSDSHQVLKTENKEQYATIRLNGAISGYSFGYLDVGGWDPTGTSSNQCTGKFFFRGSGSSIGDRKFIFSLSKIQTKTGGDKGWSQSSTNPLYGSDFIKYSWTCGDASTNSQNGCNRVDHGCPIDKAGNPVTVQIDIGWPVFYGRNFFDAGISTADQEAARTLQRCIYVRESDFNSAAIVLGFNNQFNSFGWSVANQRWLNPPPNTAAAVSMYQGYGYENVYCSDPSATVALYRVPCLPNKCSSRDSGYVHASVAWQKDHLGWSSKFGAGPLMTHADKSLIVNPYNMNVTHSECNIHYGIPALCFKKSGNSEEGTGFMEDKKIFSFSDHEKELLNKSLEKVLLNLKKAFEEKYDEWKNFIKAPEIVLDSSLTSRAQGKAFNDLADTGEEAIPLIVEKLIDQNEFMSLLVYERITGIDDHSEEWISAQEMAASYAHDWLEDYALTQEVTADVYVLN